MSSQLILLILEPAISSEDDSLLEKIIFFANTRARTHTHTHIRQRSLYSRFSKIKIVSLSSPLFVFSSREIMSKMIQNKTETDIYKIYLTKQTFDLLLYYFTFLHNFFSDLLFVIFNWGHEHISIIRSLAKMK